MTAPAFEATTPDPTVYLDRVAGTRVGRDYKALTLERLDLRPGHTVLDLGCGPGTDLAALARAVTGDGAVVGVDRDRSAVDTARQRTAGTPSVRVELGDLHHLPLPDGAADRARTDRVLQHVDDPAAALREVRRVLRPGGRLVSAEPDWETLAVDHPDIGLSRAYTRYVAERAVRNAAVGRQLPRLAAEAGFAVPEAVAITPVFRDLREADGILGLERTTRRATEAGYLGARQAERWLDHLATGPFLAAVTLYVVVADVPAGPN